MCQTLCWVMGFSVVNKREFLEKYTVLPLRHLHINKQYGFKDLFAQSFMFIMYSQRDQKYHA